MSKMFAITLFSVLALACSTKPGSNHTFSVVKPKNDETTIAVIEVVNGTRIADHQWVERLSSPSTSLDVTVSRPALLVAIWWGDGGRGSTHNAVPNNDFTVIDSLTTDANLIQCIVATKSVATGTHSVTWTSESGEGAQLWLIAVDEPKNDGTPGLGGHVLDWDVQGRGGTSITTPGITTNLTAGTGSTIIVAVAHGILGSATIPTDSEGNTFTQVGTAHAYTDWPKSGIKVWAAFPKHDPQVVRDSSLISKVRILLPFGSGNRS
jgi:hypothetical protein